MRDRLARAVLLLFLAALASCGDFDLLNPVDPPPADRSITWQTHLGSGDGDVVRSVQAISDGGFVFLGTFAGELSESELWLFRTDSAGAEQWSRTFGGSGRDTGSCLRVASDGGFILLGSTSTIASGWDVYLVKTDADGEWQWEQTYGGSGDDYGWSLECLDDGYIIVGSTGSYGAGGLDAYLVKVDAEGNCAWEQTFGGANTDEGYAVRQTSDGGYVIAGYTQASFAGDDNAWLIRTDAAGDLVWAKEFGTIAASEADIPGCLEQAKDVLLTSDGGYLLAGYTHSLGAGDFDAWLVKTDNEGNKLGEWTFGGGGHDQAEAVLATADGGFALVGMSRGAAWKQAWLLKTDSAVGLEWEKIFGGTGSEWAYCLQQTADEGYILGGSTTSYGGDMMAYLVFYKPWTEGP